MIYYHNGYYQEGKGIYDYINGRSFDLFTSNILKKQHYDFNFVALKKK